LGYSRPEIIGSDKDPEFIAEVFQTWFAKVGIAASLRSAFSVIQEMVFT